MSKQTSPYTKRHILTLGFALFAMFFGAGNLIFPPNLGRLAGDQFLLATMGFLLTGVGLPFLGILAVAKADGGIENFARHVDGRFAKVLMLIIILLIGPLLAIPRTCATTFELAILPNINYLNSWTFSFIYFGIVLFFAVNPLSVIDRIGRYLTPVLLLALAVLIIKGIFWPILTPVQTTLADPFGAGFVEGYQTMDLLGASIFGLIVLNELRHKGVHHKKRQVQCIFKAGLIAACGLALVYSGLLYLGATTSGISEDMSRADLLVAIAFNLLGREGTIILAVAVSMACLTTAIGLTVVCGQYFRNLSQGKLSYKLVCALVSAISLILSNAGVASIVKMAVIPLVALYPIVMVLVIFTLLGSRINRRRIWRGAVLGAFAVGVMEAFRRAGWHPAGIDWVYSYLPLAGSGLGWVLPATMLGFLGAISIRKGRPIIQVSQPFADYNP